MFQARRIKWTARVAVREHVQSGNGSSCRGGSQCLASEEISRDAMSDRASFYEEFFLVLNQGGVRYIVVGGVAVVLHGHARFTADIDLVIDLDPPAARTAIRALTGMGLQPRVPVEPEAFADPEQRQEWIEHHGMMVFSLYDPGNPLRTVDLFVQSPIPFDELWSRSKLIALPTGEVRVASVDDLIRMKKTAGRSQDSEDIKALEKLK